MNSSTGNEQVGGRDFELMDVINTLEAYRTAVNEAAIVSITDLQGRIIYVNENFVRISKYSEIELIGNTHRLIRSGHHPAEFFRHMWETIQKGEHWRGEIKNRAKDGSYYWVDTVITPMRDINNEVFQYLSIRNLITVQKEHEKKLLEIQDALLKSEQQLNDAQQVSRTGSWHLDIKTNYLEWSKETYHIFNIPDLKMMSYESFMETIHPEDRRFVQDSWQSALRTGSYEIEHRILTPGDVKWVAERARFEFNAAGELTGAMGTVQDITEKKKIEHILKESENIYKNLFNDSPYAIGIIDKDSMKFLEVNETATKLYGYSKEEFLSLTTYNIRTPEEHTKMAAQVSHGMYVRDRSIRAHRKKNGEIIMAEPTITEIVYKGKKAFLITINDVTEKMRIEAELMQSKVDRQNEILRTSLEAQEKSRADIGRELHDNINQLLVASTLYLKSVKAASEKDRLLVESAATIISNAIEETRKLSSSFVPPSLNEITLVDTITYFAKNFKLTAMKVDVDIRINETNMTESLKLNIYRIIQEQFNNIVKYAEAGKVKIALVQTGNQLILEVQDDGKGFNRQEKTGGIGLSNIVSRAEAYNGQVNIQTSPGHGCCLRVEFMLANNTLN